MKDKLEKLVKDRFYYVLKQSQENKADVFGFGQYFRHQIPYDQLKNRSENYFPHLKVYFRVKEC
ncbi:Ger(x)C family spore germination C-terminal domain-containing protein [Margalitia sp. FSL K6-0131]|uniref:Ger(x)C family spore germination C-terminal domain-containing protein n=1 Tax=Margalitia sp. FSL K6-0131 TaxID=2954604 RepID=UPI004046E768